MSLWQYLSVNPPFSTEDEEDAPLFLFVCTFFPCNTVFSVIFFLFLSLSISLLSTKMTTYNNYNYTDFMTRLLYFLLLLERRVNLIWISISFAFAFQFEFHSDCIYPIFFFFSPSITADYVAMNLSLFVLTYCIFLFLVLK